MAAHPDVHLGGDVPSLYNSDRKFISFRGGVDEFTPKMPFYELLGNVSRQKYLPEK